MNYQLYPASFQFISIRNNSYNLINLSCASPFFDRFTVKIGLLLIINMVLDIFIHKQSDLYYK